LTVEPIQAEMCNCVSLETATEMALGSVRLFTSHWGIGITGYASLVPALNVKKPFAFYAIAYNNNVLFYDRINSIKKQGRLSQEYFVHEALKSFSHLLHNLKIPNDNS
jgi:nicotinamide mononucleotide (NMN) deamidase PncC